MNIRLMAGLLAMSMISGCASIYTDATQAVTLITTCANSTRVIQSQCTLRTPRGAQTISTPGAVELSRTDQRVSIECESPETGKGRAEISSRENLNWAGNLNPWNLVGTAIIGIIVDSASGATSEFPKSITIAMACPTKSASN